MCARVNWFVVDAVKSGIVQVFKLLSGHHLQVSHSSQPLLLPICFFLVSMNTDSMTTPPQGTPFIFFPPGLVLCYVM